MAISYLLAPIPKWVIMNNQGEAAGGAKMYTYRSLNKVQQKAVYQDPAGTIPWTNPILFDANGSQGPFYWKSDSSNLDETYYIEVYDSNDNLLWTLDDYFPPGEGGGGNTTTYVPVNNLISNSAFIEHIDDTANPIGLTDLVVAPSNHKGFTPAQINPIVGTFGVVGPDIRFVKNNTAATDQISFVDFSLSDGPLTADVTPVQYLRYQCTNSPVGETFKAFQFPINQKVKNLAGTTVSFRLWIRCATGTEQVSLYTRQYFGSGGSPSAEVRTSQSTIDIDVNWQHITVTFVVPSVAGKSIGTAGQQTDDDALYLQLEMPLGQPCDIWFTKPALYIGAIEPDSSFDTYDQSDAVMWTPRTGTIVTNMLNAMPGYGWLPMNNGTIGNVGTGATTRANKDTFQLYSTLYTNVADMWCPVTGGRTGTGTTMAEAVADFVAGKTMALPRALGRVLGSQSSQFLTPLTFTGSAATDELTVSSTANIPTGTPILLANSGGALPSPLQTVFEYYAIRTSATTIKVSLSVDGAENNVAIDLTTDGSGTNTVLPSLGVYLGEGQHALTISEMPSHNHPGGTIKGSNNDSGNGYMESQGNYSDDYANILDVASQGGNQGHNTVQPTLLTNFFIKL